MSCSFEYILAVHYVKLNHPLMGTETIFKAPFLRYSGVKLVKLNHPLMGTETLV